MSFYDLGPLRFHSQLHTEVLWDIPSVYQKTLDPIWVSGIFYSACQKDRVFSCLWSLHLTRRQPPSFRPKWEYTNVFICQVDCMQAWRVLVIKEHCSTSGVHRIYRETRARHISPLSAGSFFFWGGGLHLDLSHRGRCFLKSSMYHVGIHAVSTTITTFSLPRYDFTFFKEFHSN